jgi:hypothetical protein
MNKLMATVIAIVLTVSGYANGYYVEMKMSVNGQKDMGNMKMYSQDENSRTEINMSMGNMGNMSLAMLVLKSSPDVVYMLNDKSKTYSEMKTNTGGINDDAPATNYVVTILGKEKVNGYNTTHVKIKEKDSGNEQEMWTTTDIEDYMGFSKIKSKYTGKSNLFKLLKDKGADGFPVRIKTNENGAEIQVDIVKAEKRNNPASLFSLDGYNKTDTPDLGIGGDQLKQMMKKLQDMTPEERDRYIEEMKKMYQQQPH